MPLANIDGSKGGSLGAAACSRRRKQLIKRFSGCQEKILDTLIFLLYDNTGEKMNEILEQALLYDFYGELLTEHQKEIYEQFVLEDLSLGEIAKEAGISRQGVHDLIKRCNQTLKDYEDKLQLVAKFVAIKDKVKQIDDLLDGYQESDIHEIIEKIRRISGEIIEEL